MLLSTAVLLATQTVAAPTLAARATQDGALVLALDHQGLDALLPDPRDAGLRAALRALPVRLERFESEDLGQGMVGGGMPAGLPWVLARLLEGPVRATVARKGEDIPGMDVPYTVTVSAPAGDAPGAARLDARLHPFLVALGAPPVGEDGGLHHVDDEPEVWWGARGDEWVFQLGAQVEHLSLSGRDLPRNASHAFALELDVGDALAETGMARELRVPALASLASGLRYRLEVGSTPLEGLVSERFVGLAARLAEHGVVSPRPLTSADLRPVPADAAWAWVGVADLAAEVRFLDQLVRALFSYGEGPLAEFEQEFGVDLAGDLCAHLGEVRGAYASDTTGGGGLLSTVLFAGVRDAAALDATLNGLLEVLDAGLRRETDGYVRTRTWEQHGARFDALAFAGLPIPLEPTLARTGEQLLIAATPQAALAAVEHLRGERESLAARAELKQALESTREPRAVGWIDVPALLPRGYGLATLGASALANFAEAEELVLPPLSELARGARPLIAVVSVEGADLVVRTRHDRSWLATLTGVAGLADTNLLLAGLALAGLWVLPVTVQPSVEARLESAEEAKVLADLHAIEAALKHYAINNGGRYPATLTPLVTPDANGATYLRQRSVPKDPWGNEYRYAPPTAARPLSLSSLGPNGAQGGADDIELQR
jgi:general secretion pathway protein G